MKKDLREFVDAIDNDVKRADCISLIGIMEEESGYSPSLHGQIIGFGLYHYVYESGREGDGIVTGFRPRSQDLSIYIMPGFSEYQKELETLGKHKSAKCCLYIRKLANVDEKVLRKIINHSVRFMKKKYECRDA